MAKARGKVILLGEHAVVYGQPALVVGIENGAEAWARFAESSTITIGHHQAAKDDGELGRAFGALLNNLGTPPLQATIELRIPAGCGLGASAAAGVALARAALELLEPSESESDEQRAKILRAAHAWETVFHGTPSGIDATAATFGGCFVYSRNQSPETIRLHQPLTLAVAVADKPANTRIMVENVAQRLAKMPERTNAIFTRIQQLVKLSYEALSRGSAETMGPLMNENHELLNELGVSTQALDRACDIARKCGALGAKLTGSGGGGCVVALCATNAESVLQQWRRQGLHCFEATIEGTS